MNFYRSAFNEKSQQSKMLAFFYFMVYNISNMSELKPLIKEVYELTKRFLHYKAVSERKIEDQEARLNELEKAREVQIKLNTELRDELNETMFAVFNKGKHDAGKPAEKKEIFNFLGFKITKG